MPTMVEPSIVVKVARGFAAKVIGRFGFDYSDFEDLTQDLLLEYQQRLSRFDRTRGTHATFARLVMRHRLCTLIESRYAQRRDWRMILPLDDLEIAQGRHRGTVCPNQNRINDALDTQLDLDRIMRILPAELTKFAELLKHYSVSSAALKAGISRATAYRRLAELRRTFETAGIRKDLYRRAGVPPTDVQAIGAVHQGHASPRQRALPPASCGDGYNGGGCE